MHRHRYGKSSFFQGGIIEQNGPCVSLMFGLNNQPVSYGLDLNQLTQTGCSLLMNPKLSTYTTMEETRVVPT